MGHVKPKQGDDMAVVCFEIGLHFATLAEPSIQYVRTSHVVQHIVYPCASKASKRNAARRSRSNNV